MRLNKYLHLLEAEGQFFAFDISSCHVLALHPRLFSLIWENFRNIGKLKEIHPDLYEEMALKGMIVEDNADETADLINGFKAIDSDASNFAITLNPTLIESSLGAVGLTI